MLLPILIIIFIFVALNMINIHSVTILYRNGIFAKVIIIIIIIVVINTILIDTTREMI